MTVDEYRIKPRGLLDRAAVERLGADMGRILAQGGRRITVDFEGVDRALAETAEPLLARMRELTEHPETGPWIRFSSLPRSLVVQFQLAGVPVENRTIVFMPGGKTAGGPLPVHKSRRTHLILCQVCEQTLRVAGSGMFGCPHCGVHFYADGDGRGTFYETLRRP